jgi:hypothetical protein
MARELIRLGKTLPDKPPRVFGPTFKALDDTWDDSDNA